VNDRSRGSRPGGRAAAVVAAVHKATLELLNERGFDALEIPEIAERSGVNKTSIYRRWSTKGELVLDVALSLTQVDVPIPNHGSLRDDLRSLLHSIADMLTTPFADGLLRAFICARDDSEVLVAQRSSFWNERFRISGALVERAIARGELPAGTNSNQLLELASSPLFFRHLVTKDPVGDEDIERLVRLAINAFTV
jgi:AcrR family transcriptional regulator